MQAIRLCLLLLVAPWAASADLSSLLKAGQELQPWLVKHRRHLHQCAPVNDSGRSYMLLLVGVLSPGMEIAGGQSSCSTFTTPLRTCASSWTR